MEGPMRVVGEETARAESLGRDLAAQAGLTDRLPNIAGKIAHLDGLNLSRAWALRAILPALSHAEDRDLIDACATAHLEAALPHVTGDYMGEHWLASFALLALLEKP